MSLSARLAAIATLTLVAGVAAPVARAAEADERPLRIGVDHSWPPHQFLDAKGLPTGFDVELFEAVAAAAGLRYEIEIADWPTLRARLEGGELDVVPGVFETPPRIPTMDFTTPTVWVHHTVFVPKTSDATSVASLPAGSRLLVADKGPHDDIADQAPQGIVVVRVADSGEALRALARGEGAAAIALDTLGLHAIRTGLLEIRSIGRPIDVMKVRFAVSEGRDELLAVLNDGLAVVRVDGTYDRIYDRWFGVLKEPGLPLRRVLPWLAALAALLLAAAAWTALLRREVARRTRSLLAAEQDRLRLERRLLQGEKMEALGRMAAGVAHDVNNVLTAIDGNLELARAQHGLAPGLRESLDEIESASHTAAALVAQLVAFGGDASGERRGIAWDEVIRECDPLLRRLLPPGVRLELESQANDAKIDGDPTQLQQVVMNLVLNARDAIRGTGTIRIVTSVVEDAGRSWCELSVHDDGPGLDAATSARAFEPFFSSKGAARGLGLATVQAVVQRHEGSVAIESEPGGGACFRVRLPRVVSERRP